MNDLPQYTPDESLSDHERMKGLVEFLSAYIEQYHGGWVRLLEFDGNKLKVEMGGACVGCPLSPHTLRGWIEGTVRQFFPDIAEVEAIDAPTLD
nr:NifU family protein [Anaerolineae bacterium]